VLLAVGYALILSCLSCLLVLSCLLYRMPAFKEHREIVDPSDLVVGRRYLVEEIQNGIEYELVLCSVELGDLNRKFVRCQGKRFHCTLYVDAIRIFDLDDVMEI